MGQFSQYLNYSIEVVSNRSDEKRGIGFLIATKDKKINGSQGFHGLSENEKRWFQTAFDWYVGNHINKKRHHGWDKSEFNGLYNRCYVFKAEHNRLYGFLCNPKTGDQSFQFCVIVAHAAKRQWKTEVSFLQIAEECRNNLLVQKAVKLLFSNTIKGNNNGKR